ncbi:MULTISPECIES: hypothetical protein [Burkholderia]|uniref:hypothetical protein n=1 Tax=Burkholderia TaxID=32008 RepID=UPI001EF7F284|nr:MULTISPECIES: hypothetical protein [Burkholderia]
MQRRFLGLELLGPAVDRAAQRHDPVVDLDVDPACIDRRIPEQRLLDILLEYCIGLHVGLPSARAGREACDRMRAAPHSASRTAAPAA